MAMKRSWSQSFDDHPAGPSEVHPRSLPRLSQDRRKSVPGPRLSGILRSSQVPHKFIPGLSGILHPSQSFPASIHRRFGPSQVFRRSLPSPSQVLPRSTARLSKFFVNFIAYPKLSGILRPPQVPPRSIPGFPRSSTGPS